MAFTGPDAFTVIIFLTYFRNGDALPGEKFVEEVNIEHFTGTSDISYCFEISGNSDLKLLCGR